MPCCRCGTRQTDPARDYGGWRRGVRGGEQVLVCPDCQSKPGWADDLDGCESCGSTTLFRRLGLTVCGDCGSRFDTSRRDAATVLPEVGGGRPAPDSDDALAQDVAAAIDRVLGRSSR